MPKTPCLLAALDERSTLAMPRRRFRAARLVNGISITEDARLHTRGSQRPKVVAKVRREFRVHCGLCGDEQLSKERQAFHVRRQRIADRRNTGDGIPQIEPLLFDSARPLGARPHLYGGSKHSLK